MMTRQLILLLVALALVSGAAAYQFAKSTSVISNNVPIREGIPVGGRIEKTEAEWRASLTPEQFYVTREKGTERAFTGELWNSHADGMYKCVCCGQELFDSKTKFDSGTGWPSFWKAVDDNSVSLLKDNTHGMQRVEVVCSRCGAHLGHLFEDGPQPTGMRYCMNSASLKLATRDEGSKETKEAGKEKLDPK
jgi:peptide-methionine (R)-S-oxide reductase